LRVIPHGTRVVWPVSLGGDLRVGWGTFAQSTAAALGDCDSFDSTRARVSIEASLGAEGTIARHLARRIEYPVFVGFLGRSI
jgi:hypothetical protein